MWLSFAGAAFASNRSGVRLARRRPSGSAGNRTSATITPLERPDEFGGRRALTPQETARLEGAEASLVSNSAKPTDLKQALSGDCKDFGRGCGYNNFWLDRGSQVVTIDGEKRTSLLIDPPDGKIPPLTAERSATHAARTRRYARNYDGPEARPLGDVRCLLAFGSSSGPPMLPVLYNNHYQIVQSKDAVMILVEMVHDARIVRLDGKHVASNVRKWMGDSIGHWEGDTLVVETTNFTDYESFRGTTRSSVSSASRALRRTRSTTIHVEIRRRSRDPSAASAFHRTDDPIYETPAMKATTPARILAVRGEQEGKRPSVARASPRLDCADILRD